MTKFRFRGRRRNRQQADNPGSVPFRAIVPNLVTSLAACAGITSIVICAQNYAMALAGKAVPNAMWVHALVALLIACICDGLDGRVARLLKASSKLGAELDSLADFVNFGVAPAMFTYFFVMSKQSADMAPSLKNMLLAFALFYALCDAFRLARFNTMLEKPPIPYWKHFFTGVPAPGGCWMVLTPIILFVALDAKGFDFMGKYCGNPYFASFMLFFVGSLMASTLPTISLKSLHVSRDRMIIVMPLLFLLIAFLVANFWLTMGVLGVLYVFSVPLTGLVFLRVRARYLASQGQPDNAQPAS